MDLATVEHASNLALDRLHFRELPRDRTPVGAEES